MSILEVQYPRYHEQGEGGAVMKTLSSLSGVTVLHPQDYGYQTCAPIYGA